MKMRVTALMENTRAEGFPQLRAELGLSLHIEHAGKRILFDTGASGAFAENAGRLGVDLAAVDAAVISHHHYDHGGGLRRFLEMNARAPVYLRSRPAGECHFRFMGLDKYIGLDQALLREHARRFIFVTERTELLPGAVVLTEVGRPYPLPRGNRYIFLESDGKLAPDDFGHELVLVLQDDGGLVVFTGCSHQGILNMVEAVTRAFPGAPIKAVFGGFHLVILPMFNFMAGSRKEVEEIGARMLRYPVERVYTGHCTGSHAFHVLKKVMGEKLERFAAGTTVEV
jgi:7,8-dihydropterin-6-yl-methyl-4-(beta-D-ribofuranosyl)aminobenzene 5'-phosphate synthase